MAHLHRPNLSIPEPLRGSDAGSFAQDTIVRRLPNIVRRTIEENEFSSSVVKDLEKLIEEIPTALIRPLEDVEALDVEEWDAYSRTYLGLNWLEIPWFFAEFYFYRRILETTGYFQSQGMGYLKDPYVLQKRVGLESAKDTMQLLCALNNRYTKDQDRSEGAIIQLLLLDLWGNKADLSLWPVGERDQMQLPQTGGGQERVVINHSEKVVELLCSLEPETARVDLVLDNAGLELVADLCLTDFLLGTGLAKTVFLHLKTYPVFVSDALIKDVDETIAFLSNGTSSEYGLVAKRLRDYLERGRLVFRQNCFWTSPLAMWEMHADLRLELNEADLVISKGDANYRRLLGDRHWAYTEVFAEIMSYFPASILALRACKSEVMCGLMPGQAESLCREDPAWMTNGQWGVIQFNK